jgi:hypothetical protein
MKLSIIDIPNLYTPIGKRLASMLADLTMEERIEILEGMAEVEFIDYRVDVYLSQLEQALLMGTYSISGSEEIAEQECLAGF